MHERDLTPQRVRLLLQLKERGAMKMSELRDALGVTATNVTALVDALEKDGMVERSAHATDRRTTMITITDFAKTRLLESCGEFKDRVSELFSDFGRAEQEQFVGLLSHMRAALIERRVLEPTSHCSTTVKEKELS
jgi:DNA-binding MarR family transcriptional regulator